MNYPNTVDNVNGGKEIANLFANKFENLYNIVGYDGSEMRSLNE